MDLNKYSRRGKINIPTEIANMTQQVTPALRIQVAPTDLLFLPDRKSYDILNLIIPMMISMYL